MRLPGYLVAHLALAAPTFAAELTIQLTDEGEAVRISTDESAGTLSVVITASENLTQAITIGNATFDPADVRKVILCAGCEETYFISAHDRSSTYGATTGLVLWPSGCCGMWWSISILPLEVAGVSMPDASGVTMIIDAQYPEKRFDFREGFLTEQTPTP